MAPKITINRPILEAFLDGELDSPDMEEVARCLEQDQTLQHLFEDVQYHHKLTTSSLQNKIQTEIDQIDWDAMSANVLMKWNREQAQPQHAQSLTATTTVPSVSSSLSATTSSVALQVQKCLPNQDLTSASASTQATQGLWWRVIELWTWLKHHPGMAMSCVATMGVIIVLAIPYLDPGPKHDHDAVVQQIANVESAQVAVLQARNKSTGKQMTVIVIDEPTQDLPHTTPPPSSIHPKKGRHTP